MNAVDTNVLLYVHDPRDAAKQATAYRVFHDVIGDGFNIDHVLIGPAGIFTV